ncbi:MAG TPA: PQQ-binding-like beta-propeller repeat protein [Gemmataceae bacterium]
MSSPIPGCRQWIIACWWAAAMILAAARAESAEPRSVWPQWRGPSRDGKVEGTAWPERLKGKSLQLLWRVELGPSYSSPIVAPDRVFVTETRDKTEEVVRALDRTTGKELWQVHWKGAVTVPAYARGNGEWIRSTPAYDGEAVYVGGMRDVLVCLEAKDGRERWRVDFPAKFKTAVPILGLVCSPLVDGEAVYIVASAALVKLDKRSGKILWRSVEDKDKGPAYASAVSSPVMATLAGKRQVLVQNRKTLAGVDPDSGEVLWKRDVPSFRGTNIITPTLYGDHSVVTSAFGGRTLCIDVTAKDNALQVRTAWDNPAQGYMSSPLVIGDHLYMHLRNQRFTCLDLRTGKERWITSGTFGKYWSMVARKDRILALDQRGILYLLRANPEKFDLLDQRKVSDAETWAHLAICGEELYVRELNALAVYHWDLLISRE